MCWASSDEGESPGSEEVRIYIERLVSWIQNTVNRMEDLVLHLSRVVCDFIRDDQGQWWFIQLKSFRSVDSTHAVSRGTTTRSTEFPEKRQTPAEIRAKLDAERGYKCRLCDLNFQEGQTIHGKCPSETYWLNSAEPAMRPWGTGPRSIRATSACPSSLKRTPREPGNKGATHAACQLLDMS